MTTNYQPKPFYLNTNDVMYLFNQVSFVPLFDGPGMNSNGIVAFNSLTMSAWDSKGNQVWDHTTQTGSYDGTALTSLNVVDILGTGFPQLSSSIGVRDVSGLHNNLYGTRADWGAVDLPFRREVKADYDKYVSSPGADYGTGSATSNINVIDSMPRIISRAITTADVNLLRDGPTNDQGHYVEWRAADYAANTNGYADLLNLRFNGSTSIPLTPQQLSHMVEGAKIVLPGGLSLAWDPALNTSSIQYTTLLSFAASNGDGDTLYGPGGVPLEDGMDIYYDAAPGAAVVYVPVGLTFDATMAIYHSLVVASGVNTATLQPGDQIPISAAQITAAIADVSAAFGGNVSQAIAEASLVADSGYGLLETLGHIDFQQPDSGEFFIGSENPGVAPVNMWFAIFGQFFDHGLDKLAAGGNGKITIALDPSDPLYGVIGADGQPTTSITFSRATVVGDADGPDGNGPQYTNHTSPFIDQSQTYGSHDQLTTLLRKWVSTDGGLTYHAGMELLDGTTLVDTWTRKVPVYDPNTGLTNMVATEVNLTLPTLQELRDHLVATGRDDLSWEDVLNLRNRDDSGHVIAGSSGSPLLLDMNPSFVLNAVPQSDVDALNLALTNAGMPTIATISYGALIGAGLINPSTNMINTNLPSYMGGAPIPQDVQDAVNEIMLDSVGDHYIAGDGRVNENFGLTSIHHVFHEEHNFQVENLKGWIYKHDNANSPVTHDSLHMWQIDTGIQDANGNFTVGVGGPIAWNDDKMFEATKLVVEMEYQHAAVDQYARTITPRIQEFVGYSTGVDSSISLEFAQSAFRFGHSTIRETIDTLDPNGWFFGTVTKYALEKAFLNPAGYAGEGIEAITLGLSRAQMNEVDEFITPALNQGLLGQPLDLAAINIARGRDMGIPTLNEMRAGLSLAKYVSWKDFGTNMIHPESLVNFIAAYSFGGDVDKAQYILDMAATGTSGITNMFGTALDTKAEANKFLNNTLTVGSAELLDGQKGFDHIDSWIGGLAEAHVPGAILGETFDAVFVAQIQALMDGDRFYYLYRLFGTNIHEEVNNGQFKDIVERNTGLEHLNGSIFAYADKYYDFTADPSNVAIDSNTDAAALSHMYGAAANSTGIWSDGGDELATPGDTIDVLGASDGIRAPVDFVGLIHDLRVDANPDRVHTVEGTPTDGADSHEVIVGTDAADYIHGRGGDDTLYGEGGNDFLYADGGVDRTYGGDGHDLIDTGEGPDLADGGAGKDIIYGRGSGSEVGGFDQLVGGFGNDLIIGGEGIDKLSGGGGDDIIYGDGLTNPEMGNTDAFTHGGDGNDYMDGGASGDLLFGEEGDDYILGGVDQDLMQGGQGDDIIRPGDQSQASGTTGGPDEVVGDDGQANIGFDLIDLSDYAGGAPGVNFNWTTQQNPLVAIDQNTPFPAWFQIEGAIGTSNNDTFIGDSAGGATTTAAFGGSNWLIGGSGNDTFTGNGGNDIIVGGSIRLDALIGNYDDAVIDNLALGSAAWLTDAMDISTGGTGYNNNTESAYNGASNRTADADGLTAGGLIEMANAAIGDVDGNNTNGIQNAFEKYFTDMLQSRMFKDVVLGDNLNGSTGADAGTDTAIFSGNSNSYTFVPQSYTDARSGVTYSGISVSGPDGHDLVVGVDNFQFANGTFTLAQLTAVPVVSIANAAAVTEGNAGTINAAFTVSLDTVSAHDVVVSYQTVDGTAISTNPGADFAAQTSTITIPAGQLSATINVAVNGDLMHEIDESFGVNLTAVTNGTLGTASASATITNDDAAPTLSINSASIAEGNAGTQVMTFTITQSAVSGTDTTVDWTTSDGTAVDPTDYALASGTATILAGSTSTTVTVTINGDADVEADEVFNIALSNPVNATIAVGSGTGVIVNDDGVVGALPTDIVWTGVLPGGNAFPLAGSTIATLSAVDPDSTTGFTYAMTGTTGPFAVSSAGVVTTTGALATNSVYTISVTVTDPTLLSYSETFTVRTGSGGSNTLTGDATDNIFYGNGGNDILVGAGGNDTLNGGTATDTLTGGAGNDLLNGGLGNQDRALFTDAVTSATFALDGAGRLTITTSQGTDTLVGVERAEFAATNYSLRIGNNLVNNFTANIAPELYLGFGGTDTVTYNNPLGVNANLATGTATNGDRFYSIENLIGGIGGDTFTGDANVNLFRGRGGADTLTGNGGNDTFDYDALSESSVAATDIITDFALHTSNSNAGRQDQINLATIDGNLDIGGNQAFAFAASASNYSVWITNNGTNTFVNADSTGDAVADLRIQVNGLLALNQFDFVL